MFDTFIYAVLPIILIVSANSCIAITLIKRYKNGELKKVHKNAKKDLNITYMLIAISLFFVISLTPVVIYLLTWSFFYDSVKEAMGFESIGWTIISLLR